MIKTIVKHWLYDWALEVVSGRLIANFASDDLNERLLQELRAEWPKLEWRFNMEPIPHFRFWIKSRPLPKIKLGGTIPYFAVIECFNSPKGIAQLACFITIVLEDDEKIVDYMEKRNYISIV